MDIKIPNTTLRKFLDTQASAEKIAEAITLCGPSVDRLHSIKEDYVYDIEVITNRVDAASAFGTAREAAAILPLFGIKAKLTNNPYEVKAGDLPQKHGNDLPLDIEIKDETLVPRFSTIVLDNIEVKSSPKPIQKELELAGIRAINNLVDVTNYLTLCYGQPTHIFDYDKIGTHKLILRESKAGEKITTLDDKTHTLKGGDIVIEDGDGKLIDLCGIMGGKNSEVDENTKRAVLFVQTYHPKKIRRTSLYTQERTLAAQIFEKQPDTRLVAPVLIEGVKLLNEWAKARIAGKSTDLYFKKPLPLTLNLDLKWLNNLIGYKFDVKTVSSILLNLGFDTKKLTQNQLSVSVPTWRLHDVTIPEDLAEETARIYGYFRLEGTLPKSSYLTVSVDPILDWEHKTKTYLADLGFTEMFNYSLVSEEIFAKANMDIEHSISLQNPLAKEFGYMRRSLIPSLLMNLENNQGKVDTPLRIFELSNIYLPDQTAKLLSGLPEERPILAMATQGLDFRESKGYLEALFNKLNLQEIRFSAIGENGGCWQTNQTSEIYSGDHFIGVFGKVKTTVKENFNLKGEVAIANLDFKTIGGLANSNYAYTPVSQYPDIVEDITIESELKIGQIIQLIKEANDLMVSVIYKTSLANKHTFEVHLNHPEHNLTQEEADKIKETVMRKVKQSE